MICVSDKEGEAVAPPTRQLRAKPLRIAHQSVRLYWAAFGAVEFPLPLARVCPPTRTGLPRFPPTTRQRRPSEFCPAHEQLQEEQETEAPNGHRFSFPLFHHQNQWTGKNVLAKNKWRPSTIRAVNAEEGTWNTSSPATITRIFPSSCCRRFRSVIRTKAGGRPRRSLFRRVCSSTRRRSKPW